MNKHVRVSGGSAFQAATKSGELPIGDQPATEEQVRYLRVQGWTDEELHGLSKERASHAISQQARNAKVDPPVIDW
jgi:hypothetical protein